MKAFENKQIIGAIKSNDCKTLTKYAKNVDINEPIDALSGQRALHLAVECRNLEMIECLLKLDANVSVTDNNGKTPLLLSVEPQFNDTTIFETMLQYKNIQSECVSDDVIKAINDQGAKIAYQLAEANQWQKLKAMFSYCKQWEKEELCEKMLQNKTYSTTDNNKPLPSLLAKIITFVGDHSSNEQAVITIINCLPPEKYTRVIQLCIGGENHQLFAELFIAGFHDNIFDRYTTIMNLLIEVDKLQYLPIFIQRHVDNDSYNLLPVILNNDCVIHSKLSFAGQEVIKNAFGRKQSLVVEQQQPQISIRKDSKAAILQNGRGNATINSKRLSCPAAASLTPAVITELKKRLTDNTRVVSIDKSD